MFCPFCSYQGTKVLESRLINDSVRRRRECFGCFNRFTTYEKSFFNLVVIKKDGRKQIFDNNKIKDSLLKACNKVSETQVGELTKRIEQKIVNKKKSVISSKEIGKVVLTELKLFDPVAYLRFASVYKSFDDPISFKKELDLIVKKFNC